jgi:hypothetical protein
MPDSHDTPRADASKTSGRDSATGLSWALESPEQHWAEHDARQLAYWRTRSPEERLAQAAEYRWRRHGDIREPAVWTWRFLEPGEP